MITRALFFCCIMYFSISAYSQWNFHSDYFGIVVDKKGFITSMKDITKKPSREFVKPSAPSPLLCLYNSLQEKYFYPEKAIFSNNILQVTCSNGSVASIKVDPQKKYIRFTLLSLSNRKDIDDIQWGPYRTTINNLMGEVIGVARDTSDAVSYAIGALALNDKTTGGPSNCVSDNATFQYIIHNPSKKHFTLPAHLHEGQVFKIGGDGFSDVAFYSHPEEYYRIIYGNTAWVDSDGDIYITYHSANRNVMKTFLYSLMPNKENNHPNHLERLPIDVDYIGSSIALWGSPDSIALLNVIQDIVIKEGLPHPVVNGKWIKDPARYIPHLSVSGNQDSAVSYIKQIGFNGLSGPHILVNRASTKAPDISFSTGKITCKDFAQKCIQNGINLMASNHTTRLPNGSFDVSICPSKNLCYQYRSILSKSISISDTAIVLTDTTYFREYSSWEGHNSYNVVKIGDEIIAYNGISNIYPYSLKNIKRGYLGTKTAEHKKGDLVYKLQATCGYGYEGLIPDIYLQDSIAYWYAQMLKDNGLRGFAFDGQEFLFNTGHGNYGVKKFFHKMFDSMKEMGIDYIKLWGATLSEGAWHYSTSWDVGGGANMYNLSERTWANEGKDLRDVCYANYFPATYGSNFGISKKSTIQDFENIQAISVGIGVTYTLTLSQKDVESCPLKYNIFNAIRTWENARAANAFPRWLKKKLADPSNSWKLEAGDDKDTWRLYQVTNGSKSEPIKLKRASGY